MSIFSVIHQIVAATRDASVQTWVRSQILKNTKAVKDLKNLQINARLKTFSLNLDLVGESVPLTVSGGYQLMVDNGKTFIAPGSDLHTSKEWLTILASEFLKGRSFEVPGFARRFL